MLSDLAVIINELTWQDMFTPVAGLEGKTDREPTLFHPSEHFCFRETVQTPASPRGCDVNWSHQHNLYQPLPPSGLGLQDNPWFCDCHISKVIEMSKVAAPAIVLLDPLMVCSGPERLTGVLFQRAELEQCLKPSAMTSATQITSTLGSNVLLRCDATGYPTPQLTWTRPSSSPVNYTGIFLIQACIETRNFQRSEFHLMFFGRFAVCWLILKNYAKIVGWKEFERFILLVNIFLILPDYTDENRESVFFLRQKHAPVHGWLHVRPLSCCIILDTAHSKMYNHHNILKKDFHTRFCFLNDYLNNKLHANFIMKQKV